MTASWQQRQHAAINAFQKQEIERLASDAVFAAECGKLDHYSRIASWPGAARGHRVLELGCGPGRYVALLASLGCDVTGADPHSFDTWQVVTRHRAVTFTPGTLAESLPFEDGSFDAVACLGALLYFQDPHAAFDEMRRVLKPGGHLAVRTVNRRHLFALARRRFLDPASRQTHTMRELRALVEAHGFQVQSGFSYGFYSPVFPGYWWYLVNGRLSIPFQQRLSQAIPESVRTNHIVFARRVD